MRDSVLSLEDTGARKVKGPLMCELRLPGTVTLSTKKGAWNDVGRMLFNTVTQGSSPKFFEPRGEQDLIMQVLHKPLNSSILSSF